MKFYEKELNKKVIFQGNIIDMEKYDIELPNKKKATREVIRHPGAVGILVIDDEDKIWLVEQYRFPIAKNLLEIPAGKIDKGEDPEQTAKRELEEETGIVSEELVSLGKIYTTAGFSDEVIHLYLAKNITISSQKLDEDEFLDIIKMDYNDFKRKIFKNEITDSKTLAAFARYELLKQSQEGNI
jgi:ADP-ribose pyrophosphatase